MSRDEFVADLRDAVSALTDEDLEAELAGVLPAEELAGLAIRIRAAAERIAGFIEQM